MGCCGMDFLGLMLCLGTHAKTPQTCYSLLHLQVWYRYDVIAVSDCCLLQTAQNWRYQTATVCLVVRSVSVWCNRMIQVCWEQTVTGMMDQQHWWKVLVSDKSGLMNTDDKASMLIQTVTIRAVTGVATLSWTDLISVLLNAVTEHAFFRV